MTEEEKDEYIKKLVQSNIDQQNKIALLSAKVYKLQKENAKVEEIKANADYQLEGRDLEIKELKETYRKQRNKRIDELQKKNAELQHKVDTLQGYLDHDIEYDMDKTIQEQKIEIDELENDMKTAIPLLERAKEISESLTKAKDLLAKWVELYKPKSKAALPTPIQIDTEQFLKEEFTTEQSNECHDCAKFDDMPKGPRCKTCDNGSHFQKKEEA